MEKFYHRVAEDILSTVKVDVIVSMSVRGISIMDKRISFHTLLNNDRFNEMVLMSGIIPRITERYAIGDREGKLIYGMIIDDVKYMAKLYLNETKRTGVY